jgi:fatty acid desaturase
MEQSPLRNSMVPDTADLPDVLPTDRLQASGMPVPALREQLRRIPNARNVLNVISVWLQTFGVLAVACIITPRLPLGGALIVWAFTFLLIGRGYSLLSILAHEAVHRCLFSRRRANDLVGRWILGYPAFIPFDAYRRQHIAHHRDELGPNEPDLNLYRNYPISRDSLLRKLRRDAFGESGYKHLRGLIMAVVRRSSRPYAMSIVITQMVLFVAMAMLSGRWWLWPLLWLAPWLTVWRVLNRLRGIAEHGGMEHSSDRRRTTHVVRQRLAPRFWIVPFNTGWHLAHHTDMGVPFQNLPALHDELVASGWVTPAIESPSYTALWKTLGSG